MNPFDQAKSWLKGQAPATAHKAIIAYALQLVVLGELLKGDTQVITEAMAVSAELRGKALKAGASEQVLVSVQMFVPSIAQTIMG